MTLEHPRANHEEMEEPRSPEAHANDCEQMTSTDSMVTVPLSDLQSNPDEVAEETLQEKLAESNPPNPPLEASESQPNPTDQEPGDITENADERGDSAGCQAESFAASVAAPQDTEDETKSLHSAAGSDSVDSDSVDWDELDKTEEQEPRSEATDEVGSIQ